MLTPRLLKKNSLTFTRKVVGSGSYDDNGRWVEGAEEADPIPTTGSLQPFKQGKERLDLPEGSKARHFKIYYTQTELIGVDDITGQEPDKVNINSIPFVVYDIEDWFTPAYRSAHYKVYLIREDKL